MDLSLRYLAKKIVTISPQTYVANFFFDLLQKWTYRYGCGLIWPKNRNDKSIFGVQEKREIG